MYYIDALQYFTISATQGRNSKVLEKIQVGISEYILLGLLTAYLKNIIIKI